MQRYALAAALVLSASTAYAEWKPEYAQLPQKMRDWYSAQEVNPEARTRIGVSWKSCCEHSDVVKTRFRVSQTKTDDKWAEDEWWYLDGNTWRKVPPDTVHWNDPTPDGQPMMFAYQGIITCFYPGDTGG